MNEDEMNRQKTITLVANDTSGQHPAPIAAEPEVPAASSGEVLAPMQHVRHEAVALEQFRLMKESYETAREALATEYEGNEQAHKLAQEARDAEYARASTLAEEIHVQAQSALQRRIDDLERSIRRVARALEDEDESKGQGQES